MSYTISPVESLKNDPSKYREAGVRGPKHLELVD